MSVVTKQFTAVKGSHLNDDQAQIVGEELDSIKTVCGQLTPEKVVSQAETDTSRLHVFFDWDDSSAADEYRLIQARHLLRSVEVYYEVEPENRTPIKAFYHIKDEDAGPSYVPLDEVLSNEDYRDQVVQKALKEMRSWAAKYRQYKELKPVIDAIDEI